ncbi:carbohydrate ABC transporter permease [uncultured Robinsoniella sp.]|uniref:carbohydrate ABC transporter permease n=1 Tax=uncultured Robinsoniella sp. TaxID=904190 RepID=UPI00374E626E
MRRMKMNRMILTVILWICSLSIIFPLLLVVINSVKTAAESDIMRLTLPDSLIFENFTIVLSEGRVFSSFLNSVIITVLSVGLSAVLGVMAAFVLARNTSRLNRAVRKYFLLGLIVPMQLISLIEVLKIYHLYNNYLGLILVYTAIFLPMTIMLSYGAAKALPKEMDEAAVTDGCGPLRLFFSVIMPLLKPVVTTVCVTQFMFIWNDFQFPLYLITDSNKWTLVLGVYGFLGKFSSQWNLVCAHILISSLPVVFVYLFGQKYIVDGMVAGAIKG